MGYQGDESRDPWRMGGSNEVFIWETKNNVQHLKIFVKFFYNFLILHFFLNNW